MEVLAYQAFIVITLLVARLFGRRALFVSSVVWSVLTLVNLFFPPLILLQLIVIWGTFFLLGGRMSHGRSARQSATSGAVRDEISIPAADDQPTRRSLPHPIKQRPTAGFDRPIRREQSEATSSPSDNDGRAAERPESMLDKFKNGLEAVNREVSAVHRDLSARLEVRHALSTAKSHVFGFRTRVDAYLAIARHSFDLKRKLDADPAP